MAIFAGAFTDDDGNPWDPNAKVLQTWPGGGSFAVRRRRICPHPAHGPFIAAARYMADRWRNELTQQNRDDWTAEGATGAGRRGDLQVHPLNGYIMLNAFDLVQLYADPPSWVMPPATYAENFLTAAVTSIDLPNQTVTFTVTMDALLPFRDETRLVTYQINPRACRHANPWRATRLIDIVAPPGIPPPPYVATVPLRWPVAAGDLFRLYWRGRVGHLWKFEADDTVTA